MSEPRRGPSWYSRSARRDLLSEPSQPDYVAIADQAIVAARPILDLEFHPAAVVALDLFFDLSWGEAGAAPGDDSWRPTSGKLAVIVNYGAFFGELLRRQFGGEWQADPAEPRNPLMSSVVFPGGTRLYAVGRAYKRLRDGASDRFAPLYEVVREALGARRSPEEADGWLRQARHIEQVGRHDLARAFYDHALALELLPVKRRQIEALAAKAAQSAERGAASDRDRALGEARSRLAEWARQGESALAAFGVGPAPGSLSLVCLEVFMSESFGAEPAGGQRHSKADLELPLGAYVGELFRTRFRGAWREDPAAPPEKWTLAWPSGLSLSPFALVAKRIAEGTGSSVLQQIVPIVGQLVKNGEAEDPPEDPKDWHAQAVAFAEKARRVDLALRFGRIALDKGGDGPAVRLRLARWCREVGRPAEALQHLEAGLKLDPTNAGLREERAALAVAQAQAVQAQADAARLQAQSEAADPHLARAASLYAQAQPEAALEAFERALELDPGRAAALLGKAHALVALQRFDAAGEWLAGFQGRADCESERTFLMACAADGAGDKARAHELFARLVDSPRLAPASRERARARAAELAKDPAVLMEAASRIEDLAQAVEALGRINAAHPGHAEAWRERGVGLEMLGRTDEAVACLQCAAQVEPGEPKSYDHEAVVLARAKRHEEAIAALDRGLRHCPASGVLLARKGAFLTVLGRSDEAMRAFEAALAADPGYLESWAFKGDLEHKLGRAEQAIASLERYLAGKSGSREKRVAAARSQLWSIRHPGRVPDPERSQQAQDAAMAQVHAGAIAAALPAFDTAVAADPLNGEAWLNRGTCLLQLGRVEDALSSYQEAEVLLGPEPTLLHGLVACLSRLGRDADVLEAYDRSLARHASNGEALLGKARTLVRLGRPSEALAVYARLLARSPADAELVRERAALVTALGGTKGAD